MRRKIAKYCDIIGFKCCQISYKIYDDTGNGRVRWFFVQTFDKLDRCVFKPLCDWLLDYKRR